MFLQASRHNSTARFAAQITTAIRAPCFHRVVSQHVCSSKVGGVGADLHSITWNATRPAGCFSVTCALQKRHVSSAKALYGKSYRTSVLEIGIMHSFAGLRKDKATLLSQHEGSAEDVRCALCRFLNSHNMSPGGRACQRSSTQWLPKCVWIVLPFCRSCT